MRERKKILFIARWYPDRHDPMLGLFVQKHALAVQAFHDVLVLYVTADVTLDPGIVVKDEQIWKGIHETRIYFGKHRNEINNALAYAKYYREGLKISNSGGLPDLVHVHILSRTALPALWLRFTQGIPYLITEHWSRYLPVNVAKGAYSGWLRKTFTRLAVAWAAGVTTVTQNLAAAMQNAGLQNRYFITPNVVDTHDFCPAERAESSLKKLVHVSCFDEPAKNIKGIIDAVQEVAGSRNDFSMEIIGDGKDFEMVKNYAASKRQLNSRITFTGLLTGNELTRKMQTADGFIMFSNYENLPCTILEALSCGVPVISTDVGGIREHLHPEFGILIAAGNKNALISSIHDLLDHPEKFDRKKMREYAEHRFSMEAIGKTFDHIYRAVLND